MHVDLLPAQPITTPVGTRMTFITTGGVIDGPRLRGELLPGGGDWLVVGSDGTGRVDVRATRVNHVLVAFGQSCELLQWHTPSP
jgi:hypothetical protein